MGTAEPEKIEFAAGMGAGGGGAGGAAAAREVVTLRGLAGIAGQGLGRA